MKLIETGRPKKPYAPKIENLKILEEFINGDYDCCEVIEYAAATAYGAASSLNRSVSLYGLSGVKAFARDGKLYLIKTSTAK